MTFNPFEPADEAAWATMQVLREKDPVTQVAPGVKYAVRYDDVVQIFTQHKMFSAPSRAVDPSVEVPIEDRMVNELNGAEHASLRHLLVTMLSAARVREAQEDATKTARLLLDSVASSSGAIDLVSRFTVPLPSGVILRLLGLPPEDRDVLAEWSDQLLGSQWQATNEGPHGHGIGGSVPDLAAYMHERIRERRAAQHRPADILTVVLEEEIDGAPLSDERIVTLMVNLLLGGVSSTANALANVLFELLRSEQLYRQVYQDRTLVNTAVEEGVRFRSPVPFVARTCAAPTSLSGVPIEVGERVVIGISPANRDDRFADAGEFRLDRPGSDRHIAYGSGIHKCVGAAFARMIMRTGIEALMDAFAPGELKLLEESYVPAKRFMEWGPATVLVRRSA